MGLHAPNQTSFKKGKPGGPGRPRLTEEQKRLARIQRAVDYDFKQECRALLPMATDQLAAELEKKKLKGPNLLRSIEVLRDSVHGKPAQTIVGADGGPLIGSFTVMLKAIDGAKSEAFPEPT